MSAADIVTVAQQPAACYLRCIHAGTAKVQQVVQEWLSEAIMFKLLPTAAAHVRVAGRLRMTREERRILRDEGLPCSTAKSDSKTPLEREWRTRAIEPPGFKFRSCIEIMMKKLSSSIFASNTNISKKLIFFRKKYIQIFDSTREIPTLEIDVQHRV